jgi:periodic tryptophan protein 2
LPFSHRKNIDCIDLNAQGNLLLSVDEDGRAILTIIPRRISIYHFSFKSPVTALTFSPSGEHFLVGLGRKIQAWLTPPTPDTNTAGVLDFAPFVLHREYGGHFDDVQSLSWSRDARFFVSASRDMTARIWSLDPEEGFEPTVLSGHREGVKNAWFSSNQELLYTVSQDGAVFRWEFVSSSQQNSADDEILDGNYERWRIVQREYFLQNNAKVKCASFHASINLLTVGFSTGLFCLYELPSFSSIHMLSLASSPISSIATSPDGAWLALGSSKTGQLLVWEHASESNILKQSSHLDTMTSLSYSPDSTRIITGSDDGLVKIWDLQSGFHIATFTEHTSAVTSSRYSKRGNILFTSSLDGSIRAWDMLRFRNFRTFTAPTRLSFTDLAIDPSAEIVCASSHDSFDIHLWNVQTGQLLDRLPGHEGPVSTLAFVPDGSTLASGSWDHTIRLWSIFARTQSPEPLQLTSDLLCIAIRPDSSQLAAATLDGQLTFWNLSTSAQSSVLDARRDVSGGRSLTSRRTAANSPETKQFTTITYSADGSCLLAAGNSKYVCLYAISTLTLVKKFTVSVNLSLDGTQEFLNSSAILSNGMPKDMIDTDGEASDLEDRIDRSLPGAMRTGNRDVTSRQAKRPIVRVTGLEFSPTGRGFCVASTEGLLIYSLDTQLADFDPFELDMDVTPQSTRAALAEKEYLKALVMAFRLSDDQALIKQCYEAVPYQFVPLLVRSLPRVYLGRILRLLGEQMDESPHLEFHLRWLKELLQVHGNWIKENRNVLGADLRSVLKGVDGVGMTVRRLAESNGWEIEFLVAQADMEKCNVSSDSKKPAILNGHDVNGGSEIEHDGSRSSAESASEDDSGGWMGLD